MKNNLKTFPQECSSDPVDQWRLAFEAELRELLAKYDMYCYKLPLISLVKHGKLEGQFRGQVILIKEILGE